jgi:hypothetical protein
MYKFFFFSNICISFEGYIGCENRGEDFRQSHLMQNFVVLSSYLSSSFGFILNFSLSLLSCKLHICNRPNNINIFIIPTPTLGSVECDGSVIINYEQKII